MTIYEDISKQHNLLISGVTGSGKSTVINNCMPYIKDRWLLLVDFKRVELKAWKKANDLYATTIEDTIWLLESAKLTIEKRFEWLEQHNEKAFRGYDVYVIIDEYVNITTAATKDRTRIEQLLTEIMSLGRAVNVHVWIGTQKPNFIPTFIRVNATAILGLHCNSARESRNVIETSGCEKLPFYGFGIYKRPLLDPTIVELPLT